MVPQMIAKIDLGDEQKDPGSSERFGGAPKFRENYPRRRDVCTAKAHWATKTLGHRDIGPRKTLADKTKQAPEFPGLVHWSTLRAMG
jgi:hypothetical protein